MLKQRRYQVMGMAVALLTTTLLGSCSEEAERDDAATSRVHLMLGSQGFRDVRSGEESPLADTRALPAGFNTYNSMYSPLPEYAQIQGFFIPDAAQTAIVERVFTFADTEGKRSWESEVPIKSEGTYYFYGFMPKEEAGNISIVQRNGNYSNGAVLTINGIKAVTASDPCVVVGVKLYVNSNPETPLPQIVDDDLDMASRLGKFDFTPALENNYLYLLVDHLYCSVKFMMNIEDYYNELRTIKVKKISMKVSKDDSSQALKTVNATVTLVAATDSPWNPLKTAGASIVFREGETGEPGPAVIYDYTTDTDNPNGVQLETDAKNFRACLIPGYNGTCILETVYDVYDSKGNLIRENETAVNTFNPGDLNLQSGQEYTYTITVKPTYLYMLSDPDLDSPTFSLN